MTPTQQLIYDYIFLNQSVCDLCISNAFGFEYNQYGNTICRQLYNLKLINRIKGHCKSCNRNVILNSVINAQ
jgi:hypothetical protein